MSHQTKEFISKHAAILSQLMGETLGFSERRTLLQKQFIFLEKMSKELRENYKDVVIRVERFADLPSTSTLEDVRSMLSDKTLLMKMSLAFEAIAMTLGGENSTTLGKYYLMTSVQLNNIQKDWMDFQVKACQTYVQPVRDVEHKLKEILKDIKLGEQQRLYMDAQKSKLDKQRVELKDPSRIKHLEHKINELEKLYIEKTNLIQDKMQHVFFELEDDQLALLLSLVEAQAEFYLSGYERLHNIALRIRQASGRGLKSILGIDRESSRSTAIYEVPELPPARKNTIFYEDPVRSRGLKVNRNNDVDSDDDLDVPNSAPVDTASTHIEDDSSLSTVPCDDNNSYVVYERVLPEALVIREQCSYVTSEIATISSSLTSAVANVIIAPDKHLNYLNTTLFDREHDRLTDTAQALAKACKQVVQYCVSGTTIQFTSSLYNAKL